MTQRFITSVSVLCALLALGWAFSSKAMEIKYASKTWQFATSSEGWTETRFGNDPSQGTPVNSETFYCTWDSFANSCNILGELNYSDTWANTFGIPENAFVLSLVPETRAFISQLTTGLGHTCTINSWRINDQNMGNDGITLTAFHNWTHTQMVDPVTKQINEIPIMQKATSTFTEDFQMTPNCARRGCSSMCGLDNIKTKIKYIVPRAIQEPIWLRPFIPTAYATTTCAFTVNTPTTTTAECGDATSVIADDPTRNLYYGLTLFFIVFFGLLFMLKKKGGE